MRKRRRESEKLARHEREAVESYLHGVQFPNIDALAEREWVSYVTTLAWERMQDNFDEKTKKAFELLSKGRPAAEVAEELGISTSSAYVYKKRVQDRLREEIMKLNAELD